MSTDLTSSSPSTHSPPRFRDGAALALACIVCAVAAAAQKPLADLSTMNRFAVHNAPAYQALQEGRVADAAAMLRETLAADPTDAGAHQLLCRAFYAQDWADQAIHECEAAVASKPASSGQASDSQLWLGRAYGMEARHAGPIARFKLARRVQSSFARAVELNPANVAALKDLGEYDVNAPFIVGGGIDKAQALASDMMQRFPGPAHMLLARIAVENKDQTTAESEFKQEIAIELNAEAWMDLAHFYATHERPVDAESAVKSGLALDRMHGAVLVDAASILTASHRNPDLAERCLRDYLASHAKSDAAPAFKVHLQLSRLLVARGDQESASREAQAAAALAPGFAKNSRAVQGL